MPPSQPPALGRYALTDGRSRTARVATAVAGAVALLAIWTACALLRDDANRKLAERAAGQGTPTGVAAQHLQPAAHAAPSSSSHTGEYLLISGGIVTIGILLAFMSTDVLGHRLRHARQRHGEYRKEWERLRALQVTAQRELARLLRKEAGLRRSLARVERIAWLQADLEHHLRAARQHDVHGYWSELPDKSAGDGAVEDHREDADVPAEPEASVIDDLDADVPSGGDDLAARALEVLEKLQAEGVAVEARRNGHGSA